MTTSKGLKCSRCQHRYYLDSRQKLRGSNFAGLVFLPFFITFVYIDKSDFSYDFIIYTMLSIGAFCTVAGYYLGFVVFPPVPRHYK